MNDTDKRNRLTALYDALRALANTDQGDWRLDECVGYQGGQQDHAIVDHEGGVVANNLTERDARLVVAMRNAIPAIVAEIGDLHNLRTAVKAAGHSPTSQLTTWEELAHENRRLRTMMDALTRAGLGAVALVEVFQEVGRCGITVTRADGDEKAFAESLREGLGVLASTIFDAKITEMKRVGVTEEDEK